MEFLLILFIIFVVIPCAYLGYKIWRGYRTWRNFRQDPIGFFMHQAQKAAEEQARNTSKQKRQNPQRPPKRKKKIASDLGEYVEFTEITTVSQAVYTDSGVKYRKEEQIQDIKWEEIK